MIGRIAAFVALILSAALATAAILAHGGRWSLLLDVLTHFAPLWLGGSVAAAILAALLRQRIALVLAVVGVTAAALLMTPEIGKARRDPPAAATGPTLKLVQFNLWGRNRDPRATLDWILSQDADVIVTEEAMLNAAEIRQSLQRAYPHWSSCDLPRPCEVMVHSRLPMTARGAEKGIVWATYLWQGRPVTVVGYHATWPVPPGEQSWQLRRLARLVARMPAETTILAGDLNSTPWSFTLQRLDREMGLRRRTHGPATWPAGMASRRDIPIPAPFLAIDQVFAGAAWRTVDVRRGPKLGSDHYPVVVELTP